MKKQVVTIIFLQNRDFVQELMAGNKISTVVEFQLFDFFKEVANSF